MKNILAPVAVFGFLAVVGFAPPAMLAGLTYVTAENLSVEQDVQAAPPNWEYEVVGLSEIYGSTLDYLKAALEGDKKDLLKLAKRTDDQLVAKTRDLLNEYGKQGWELVEYRENVLVFKRPAR